MNISRAVDDWMVVSPIGIVNGSPMSSPIVCYSLVEEAVKTTDLWIKVFVKQCTLYIIFKLNEISKEYRIVAKHLDELQLSEKEEVKVSFSDLAGSMIL